MGNRSLKTRSSPMSSRSCAAASSWSSASKARVWMSSRCGMSIRGSSFPNEISFIVSAMTHPQAGENSPAPAACEIFGSEGRGAGADLPAATAPRASHLAPRLLHLDDRALLLELGLHAGCLVLRDA